MSEAYVTNEQLAVLVKEAQKTLSQISQNLNQMDQRLHRVEAKIDNYENHLVNLSQGSSKQIKNRKETPIKSKTAYPYLILKSLIELNGTAHVHELMERVKYRRGSDFKRHSATARRADMVRSGYIQGSSQVWEITDRGREKVKTLRLASQ